MTKPRVALTTSLDRATQLVEIVKSHRCEPVLLPCVAVEPMPDPVLTQARQNAEKADWLLITSARAISVLWPSAEMPGVPVAAVGRATGDAVEAAGGHLAVVGESGLLELLDRWGPELDGDTVFLPHSSLSDLAVLRELASHTHLVTLATYSTRPIAPADDKVDAALFASPSAVSGWLTSRPLDDVLVGAIGDTTAATLINAGHPPHVVPIQPSFEELIELTAHQLRDRSHV